VPPPSEPFAAFADALLDPERQVPAGLWAPGGAAAAARRFAVHRNTVTVSLVDVLAAAFPAVLALVGEAFFRAAAAEFVRARPPRSPVLIAYGGDFPAFLAGFPPAAGLAYLGDVARLEWARTQAFNAAEAQAAEIGALAGIPRDRLPGLRFRTHPSASLLRSAHPFVSLWAESTGRAPRTDLDLGCGENALVLRSGEEVEVHRLSTSTAGFLEAVLSGEMLATAATASEESDLPAEIAALFGAGLVVAILPGEAAGPENYPEGTQ